MALPKNIRPEYSTTIPSSGKRIKYQPFSVKEEKILILAAETQETDEITNAVANVLQNCVTSPADFNVEDLALFDIEYLFLKTRAKSVGEKLSVTVTDPTDETFTVEHEINIDKIGVVKNKDHSDIVKISDDITVKMNYPDITFFNEGINTNDITNSLKLISRCVHQIVVGDEVYNRVDMTDDEISEWLEGLTQLQFNEVLKFFTTMPKLSHTITIHNTKKDSDFTVVLEGLQDFF